VDVRVATFPDDRVRARIHDVVHGELAGFAQLRDDLVAGRVSLF
jgi:hypothetical protein